MIAIEEHYLDPEVDAALGGQGGGDPRVRDRLFDLGEGRLREMDAAGIDVQVLSHCPPGAQAFDAESGAELARGVNDRLQGVVQARPERFAAFATLPTRDPQGSADELARCVEELGFRGAMAHGLTDGHSSTSASSGRSLNGRRPWTCQSTSTPVGRTRPWWMRITPTTRRSTQAS